MQPIRTDKEIKLSILLENTDNKLRVVGYHALAEVIACAIIKTVREKDNISPLQSISNTNTTLLTAITISVDYVSELSIIDRTLLDSILRKYISAKINITDFNSRQAEIYKYRSVLDILGVSGYYTLEDLKLIEDNIDHYKAVAVAAIDILDKLVNKDKVGL